MVGMQGTLDLICCTAARVNGRLKRIFALLRVLLINLATINNSLIIQYYTPTPTLCILLDFVLLCCILPAPLRCVVLKARLSSQMPRFGIMTYILANLLAPRTATQCLETSTCNNATTVLLQSVILLSPLGNVIKNAFGCSQTILM